MKELRKETDAEKIARLEARVAELEAELARMRAKGFVWPVGYDPDRVLCKQTPMQGIHASFSGGAHVPTGSPPESA